MKIASRSLFLLLGFVPLANAGDPVTMEGLITPRDNEGMYVRNPDGQFEIGWTEKTEVALEVNTRIFKGFEQDVLHYSVHSSPQVIDFPVPKGPVTGIITLRGSTRVDDALKVEEISAEAYEELRDYVRVLQGEWNKRRREVTKDRFRWGYPR